MDEFTSASGSGALPMDSPDDTYPDTSGSPKFPTTLHSKSGRVLLRGADPQNIEAKELLKVEMEAFRLFLDQVSFQENGDQYERTHGSWVTKKMPNSELFWRKFIVPLTARVEGYPGKPAASIRFRPGVDTALQDIAAVHYSCFLNLIYAHSHLEEKGLSWLKDFYSHLGSACDLAETFLEKWYFLYLRLAGQKSHVLQTLTRKEFGLIAGHWYDINYKDLFQYYLSKGKQPPLNIIAKEHHIIKEFLSVFLKQGKLWKRYIHVSMPVRQFRNAIVHDVQIAQLIDHDGNMWMPRPEKVDRYRTWREVGAIAGSTDVIKRDFVLPLDQARADLDEFEDTLNDIWGVLIVWLEPELYVPGKPTLQDLYRIELATTA